MPKTKRAQVLAVPDAGIIGSVTLLVIFGLMLVFDASYGKAGDSSHYNYDTMYFFKRTDCLGNWWSYFNVSFFHAKFSIFKIDNKCMHGDYYISSCCSIICRK